MARAEITLPASSSKTSTVTTPDARRDLALGGYCGLGRLTALPLRTPPEMGLGETGCVLEAAGGFGFAVGGAAAAELEAGGLALVVDVVLSETGATLGGGDCGAGCAGWFVTALVSLLFSSL